MEENTNQNPEDIGDEGIIRIMVPPKISGTTLKRGTIISSFINKEKILLKLDEIIAEENSPLERVMLQGIYVNLFNGKIHQRIRYEALFKDGDHWTSKNSNELKFATPDEIDTYNLIIKSEIGGIPYFGAN